MVAYVFNDACCRVNTAAVYKVTEKMTELSRLNVVMLVASAAYSTAAQTLS